MITFYPSLLAYIKTGNTVEDVLFNLDIHALLNYVHEQRFYHNFPIEQIQVEIAYHVAQVCSQCDDFAKFMLNHSIVDHLKQSDIFKYGWNKRTLHTDIDTLTVNRIQSALISRNVDHFLNTWKTFYDATSLSKENVVHAWSDRMHEALRFFNDVERSTIVETIIDHALANTPTAFTSSQIDLMRILSGLHVDHVSSKDAWTICSKYEDEFPPALLAVIALPHVDAQRAYKKWSKELTFRADLYDTLQHYVSTNSFSSCVDYIRAIPLEYRRKYVDSSIPLSAMLEFQYQTGSVDVDYALSLTSKHKALEIFSGLSCITTYSWAIHMLDILDQDHTISFLQCIGPLLLPEIKDQADSKSIDYVSFFYTVLTNPSEQIRQRGLFLLLQNLMPDSTFMVPQICLSMYPEYIALAHTHDIQSFDTAALFIIGKMYPEHVHKIEAMTAMGIFSIVDQLEACFMGSDSQKMIELDMVLELDKG